MYPDKAGRKFVLSDQPQFPGYFQYLMSRNILTTGPLTGASDWEQRQTYQQQPNIQLTSRMKVKIEEVAWHKRDYVSTYLFKKIYIVSRDTGGSIFWGNDACLLSGQENILLSSVSYVGSSIPTVFFIFLPK